MPCHPSGPSGQPYIPKESLNRAFLYSVILLTSKENLSFQVSVKCCRIDLDQHNQPFSPLPYPLCFLNFFCAYMRDRDRVAAGPIYWFHSQMSEMANAGLEPNPGAGKLNQVSRTGVRDPILSGAITTASQDLC